MCPCVDLAEAKAKEPGSVNVLTDWGAFGQPSFKLRSMGRETWWLICRYVQRPCG